TTAVAALALSAWPGQDRSSVRLAVAVVLGFGWVSAIATRLIIELGSPSVAGSALRSPTA
ncbi:MAG: hypothetical protein ACRDVZ_13260, partial [Jiangellaceae bacterium]